MVGTIKKINDVLFILVRVAGVKPTESTFLACYSIEIQQILLLLSKQI